MSDNLNRPVIKYNNIALFQSDTGANSTRSNSGHHLSFLPYVQSMDFSFDVNRNNSSAIGTKNFINQSSQIGPDVLFTINTLEDFGDLFNNLFKDNDTIKDNKNLETDRNFYAVIGENGGNDISGKDLSGQDVLSFGNCFLDSITLSQSVNSFLTSSYSFTASNVQAQKAENRVVYYNDFENLDIQDYDQAFYSSSENKVVGSVGGELTAADLEDGRGLTVTRTHLDGIDFGEGDGIAQTENRSGLKGNRSLVIYDGALINRVGFSGFEPDVNYATSGTFLNRNGLFRINYETGSVGLQGYPGKRSLKSTQTQIGDTTGTFNITGILGTKDGLMPNQGQIVLSHRKSGNWAQVDYVDRNFSAIPANTVTIQNFVTEPGESQYIYISGSAPLTWGEAYSGAASNNSTSGNGRLAVIDTAEKYQKLLQYLTGNGTNELAGNHSFAWIGLTDTGSNDEGTPSAPSDFSWINGVSYNYNGLGTGFVSGQGVGSTQPDNSQGAGHPVSGEDFVHIYPGTGDPNTNYQVNQASRWNDADFSGAFGAGTPRVQMVSGYILERIITSTHLSDLTIRKLDEYEVDAPSLDLTGDQSQSTKAYFSGIDSYYTNQTGKLIPHSKTNISIKRNSFEPDEFVTTLLNEDVNPETGTPIVLRLRSRFLSSVPNANPLDSEQLTVEIPRGNVVMNELELNRGISCAKIKIKDGDFQLLDSGRFDTHNSSTANHGTLAEAQAFLDSFEDGEMLALVSCDSIAGGGIIDGVGDNVYNITSTERNGFLTSITNRLKNDFGCTIADTITARDMLNFVSIKGGSPIYEELGVDDSPTRYSENFEEPQATVHLPKNSSEFLFQSNAIQSFDLNLPIARKPIYSLGKKHPIKRKTIYPNLGSISINSIVSDLPSTHNQTDGSGIQDTTQNLKTFLQTDGDFTISISGQNQSDETFNILLKEAKLDSKNFNSSIGSNSESSLSFSFDVDKVQNSKRLFNKTKGLSHGYSMHKINSEYTGYCMKLQQLGHAGVGAVAEVRFDEPSGIITQHSKIDIVSGSSSAKNLGEFVTEPVAQIANFTTGGNLIEDYAQFSVFDQLFTGTDVQGIHASTIGYPNFDSTNLGRLVAPLTGDLYGKIINSVFADRLKYKVKGFVADVTGSVTLKPSNSYNGGGGWTPSGEGNLVLSQTGEFTYEFIGTRMTSNSYQPNFGSFMLVFDSGDAIHMTNISFEVTQPEPHIVTWYDQFGSNNISGITDAYTGIDNNGNSRYYSGMMPYLSTGGFSDEGVYTSTEFIPAMRVNNRHERISGFSTGDANVFFGAKFNQELNFKTDGSAISWVGTLYDQTHEPQLGVEVNVLLGNSAARRNDIFYMVSNGNDPAGRRQISVDGIGPYNAHAATSFNNNEFTSLQLGFHGGYEAYQPFTGQLFQQAFVYESGFTGIDALGFMDGDGVQNPIDSNRDAYYGRWDMRELVISSGSFLSGQKNEICGDQTGRFNIT